MDRLNISQSRVDELRAEQQTLTPDYADPAPASALKLDDDVEWLGFAMMRVVWGHEDPDYFIGYSPDIFGEYGISVEAQYVTDRAPADPEETPMPIYPQQQQQRQAAKKKHDKKAALQHVLKQLDPEHAKKVRELVKQHKPELLEGEQ